jgi:hypothetical protein
LKSVQRALREAFLTLPPEEYQWFDLHSGARRAVPGATSTAAASSAGAAAGTDPLPAERPMMQPGQGREFFQFPGPLHSALISPASAVLRVNAERGFRCIARDKSRRSIDEGVQIRWRIRDGGGRLSAESGEIVAFTAPGEPGLSVLVAEAVQGDIVCFGKAIVTVTETLVEKNAAGSSGKGLPGYTFLRLPGELWRSRYDEKNNLVVINNGHKDYQFAAPGLALRLVGAALAAFGLVVLLIAPGLALILDSWLVLTASVVVYALFRALVAAEDRWLKEKFGAGYEEYRRKVLLKFF